MRPWLHLDICRVNYSDVPSVLLLTLQLRSCGPSSVIAPTLLMQATLNGALAWSLEVASLWLLLPDCWYSYPAARWIWQCIKGPIRCGTGCGSPPKLLIQLMSKPRIASMATLALNSGLWMRSLFIDGSPLRCGT